MDCSTPGLHVHHELPEFTQTHVHWVSDTIQPSHPLSSPSAFILSQHWGLFKWVSSLHQMAKVLKFQYSGLISFRMDWLDRLAVQGTLKSLLQYHSSKASIRQCSPFFIVQLSHPYMTTGKTRALTRWNLLGEVMSLLFNILSRLVIAFLQRSNHLLISWCSHYLQWFWSPQNKVCHCFRSFPIYLPWSDGTRCTDLVFWMLSFKATFSLSSFTFIKSLLSSSSLSAISGVICISEVIDISPGNLDSSLCFFQSSISHDVLCI